MITYFFNLNHVIQALIAGLVTFAFTVMGSAVVFFFKKVNKNILDAMLGLSAGVMVAASFFSLLNPALKLSESLKMIPWLTVAIGFIFGGVLLFIGDKIFHKLFTKKRKNNYKRIMMLILSITLHNIPEGLVVGVAFGSISYNIDGATTIAAIILSLGIALQNFPEGTAISLPLRREGLSRKKAFIIGMLTAIVEPISALIGAFLVLKIRFILPILLSFAAGAMIYVVVEEIIPESQSNNAKDLMAFFTIIGFCIMMILDVALG